LLERSTKGILLLKKAATARREAKALAENKFYCAICDHAINRNAALTKHQNGPKHVAKAGAAGIT
jgi:hypothetical protein